MAKTTAELKDAFRDGAYEELLKDIYVDKNMLEYMHYETVWFAMSHLLERIEENM